MKASWLSRSIIQSPLYIGLCTDEASFHRALRQLKMPREEWPDFLPTSRANAAVHFFDGPDGDELAVVCIHIGGRRKRQVDALLVHEAMHVWRAIRDAMGERFPSQEFEAYAMQAICLELFDAYDQHVATQRKAKRGRR